MLRTKLLLTASVALLALIGTTLVTPAIAARAVCAPPVPKELCGGRVFPEPMRAASGLTYAQMVAGVQALEDEFPEWVTFDTFGGSADGLDLYTVEITSPDSTIPLEDRKIVLANQSIHGNEPGGREGAVRYMEDLLRDVDPDRKALLDRVRLIQTFINPDGWTAGDHDHVQTGGGVGLWARQNGDGAITGAADFGFGTDLNRQAPWRGISHSSGPLSAPEAEAFADYVTHLAATGDIQASVDIHGEVTDAAAWVMLSSGQFDLSDAMTSRYHGEAVHANVAAALETSQARELMESVPFGGGEIAPTVLTASSEFGSIASESTASGTGFQGDWMAQPEGGDSASLSTIELYNFFATPGVSSLTARREVMQLYRDTVAGILGGLIEQAALEHVTTLAAGTVAYVDDAPRFTDPVRGVTVSSADFFADLAPLMADGSSLTAIHGDDITGAAADSIIVTTGRLLGDADAVADLRAYAEAGGNVVLTDAALQLLPSLVDDISVDDLSTQFDDGGKVSYDRSHPLADGIREIAWLNTETATMGLKVEGSGTNVPAWRVATDAWEAAGGTTAGVSGNGQTSVGEIGVGDGTIRTIGVLLPDPDPDAGNIQFGINGYGVIDTGYIVLANALNGELVQTTTASVE